MVKLLHNLSNTQANTQANTQVNTLSNTQVNTLSNTQVNTLSNTQANTVTYLLNTQKLVCAILITQILAAH